MVSKKVLLVDDEPNVLNGYRRHLRKHFDIDIAESGAEALKMVESKGPYAVVVSDMKMPEMNGLQLLSQLREQSPATIRVMLTGNADQQTAVDAVNQGNIFQFLNKPCSPDILMQTLDEALQQYRLAKAEEELLSSTLQASIGLMTDVLSLVNPIAFGRTTRIQRLTQQLCKKMNVPNAWEVEIAAMLSQIGCVAVPQSTLDKVFQNEQLTTEEHAILKAHPEVGSGLVEKIPRLEGVADVIRFQNEPYRISTSESSNGNSTIPLGSRILKVVLDYDRIATTRSPSDAIFQLTEEHAADYDAKVVSVLVGIIETSYVTKTVNVLDLETGMIFEEHVNTLSGDILIAKGQEVNASLLRRLHNFARTDRGVEEPIRVRCMMKQLV